MLLRLHAHERAIRRDSQGGVVAGSRWQRRVVARPCSEGEQVEGRREQRQRVNQRGGA